MDIEPDHFHGHHTQFMDAMPTVQLHSMDIVQPSAPVLPEHRMDIVNQPPPFMQPQPTFTNRHPLSFHVSQAGSQQQQQVLQQVPQQPLPQQLSASPSPVSSPDTPKKKKKKDKRSESPSNSPKGRGRYACLLHRQKHKRCPPDCPERKPKPMKSPSGGAKKMSPRKAKLFQSNQMELGQGEVQISRPSKGNGEGNTVERPTWESAVSWEDLQWNELNPVQGWNAWDDLRSSSHWEESKKPVPMETPKLQEFDPNQFLMEDRLLQLSDSPEGGVMSDVKVTEF